MKDSTRYETILESGEDQCYVGSSPGLIYGGGGVIGSTTMKIEDASEILKSATRRSE